MGKKVKNPKLLKQQPAKNQSMLSVFNRFANKVADSHKKKIEKVGDTKQRLIETKKTNKMIKVSKRTSKFALIDDEPLTKGLTHKGKSINDLKEFNDMNFGSDVEDDEFLKVHENLNFTGFDEQDEVKQKNNKDPNRPKTKAQVYKEIIDKSKLHRHIRQQIYEENLEKATELDNQLPELISKLKFRNRDSNVRDKISHLDHEFEKLANQLKEDEKVVSNKVMEKNEKYTDKVKRKKNEQLNSLMKDSSDSEDIRKWAKNANEESEIEGEEEDEIDDVQLSSEEEESAEEDDEQGQELSGSGMAQDSQEGEKQQSQEQEQQSEQEAQPEPEPIKQSNNKKKISKPSYPNRHGKSSKNK